MDQHRVEIRGTGPNVHPPVGPVVVRVKPACPTVFVSVVPSPSLTVVPAPTETGPVAKIWESTSASFTAWQSANIGKVIQQATATSSSATSTSQTSPITPTSSAESSTAKTASNDAGNNKLSTALGAGLGIPLGIAALGLLAFLLWKMRRQKQTQQQQQLLPPPNYAHVPEMGPHGNTNTSLYQPASEMGGEENMQGTWQKKQISEMDSRPQQHEIYTRE
ncbi:MAG: hypothetical protein Q9168_002972 [Polycauliona sp. 1 TL-2023]